jgi:hypothetical protein
LPSHTSLLWMLFGLIESGNSGRQASRPALFGGPPPPQCSFRLNQPI